MRFIITGASGHIGNNLVRMINSFFPDDDVIALCRRRIDRELQGTNCTQITGNLENEAFLSGSIHENDVIIHSAGLIDITDTKQDEMYRINYLMTKKLCDIALAAKVKKFIYIGSVDAIPKSTKSDIITEPEAYSPELMPTGYGRTKALATQYVLDTINKNPDFNAGIIMPTAVIGINDYKPSEAGKIIRDTINGKPEFGIPGGYNFVDVRDVSRAILSLVTSKKRGQYIISGENVSVRELYDFINRYKVLKKHPIIFPTWVAKLACPFVKMLTRTMIEVLTEPHNYSSLKASKDLGYTPTPIYTALKDTVDWFCENN